MKIKNLLTLFAALQLTSTAACAAGAFTGGNGSQANPYQIATTDDLDLLASQVNAGTMYKDTYFVLTNNITYDGTENNFIPIGNQNENKCFAGHFDGKGYTISGININKNTEDYKGLFGRISTSDGSAEVKNLTLDNSRIEGLSHCGGIAGYNYKGNISNCHVTSSVTIHGSYAGASFHGGIVGYNDAGAIIGCTSSANVTASSNLDDAVDYGGIVGNNLGGSTIENCLVYGGNINGYSVVGAVAGDNAGTLTNNRYTMSVTLNGKEARLLDGTGNGHHDGANFVCAIIPYEGVTLSIPSVSAMTEYPYGGLKIYTTGMSYKGQYYNIISNDGVTTNVGVNESGDVTFTATYSGSVPEYYAHCGFGYTSNATTTNVDLDWAATDGTATCKLCTYIAINYYIAPTILPINYTITYNSVEGATFATANPTTYTVESKAITLVNPTKDGYTFLGWTYEGQSEPTTSVTIAKGSTGDKTFTANWTKHLTASNIADIAAQTYTGSEIRPTVVVTDGETTLTQGTDYTISYSNNTNAGTAVVTITGIGNYTRTVEKTFVINPAAVTLTANSGIETYNGTEQTVSGFTCSVEGLTFDGVTATVNGTNAGEYDVTFTGATVNTTKDATGNYVVTELVNGTLTINPAAVTLTANSGIETYNGTEQTVSGFTCSVEGLTFESVAATVSGTNAGKYDVTFAGATLNTTTDVTGNYVVTELVNGKLTINPAAVTLTANSGTETYNGAVQTISGFTCSVEGLNFEGVAATISGTNAGEYDVTFTGATLNTTTDVTGNYVVTELVNGKLTINPAAVTLTANSGTETYNGAEQTVSGFTCSVEGLTFESVAATVSGTNAGEYDVTFAGATVNTTKDATGNYIVTELVNGTLTINPAAVTLTANSSTETYNGTEQTVSGFTCSVEGLTFDGVTATVSGTNAGEYDVTFTGATLNTTKDATGNYVVTELVNGKLTINPAAVTLTANSSTETYNGAEQTVSGFTCSVEGLTFGGVTATVSGTNAGEYDVTFTGANLNTTTDVTGNYVVTELVNGKLTINPAAVTLTANSGTETYNGTEQTVSGFTCSIEGLTFEGVTATVSGTNAGEYDVIFTGVTLNTTTDVTGNYIVTELVNGTLKINKAVPAYTLPTITEQPCDVKLTDIQLGDGFKFVANSAELTTGENNRMVVFTPADATNYEIVEDIELTINVKDHVHAAAVYENVKAATCTEAGSQDSVVYCSICNAEICRKTIEIPTIEHTADSVVKENVVEPTLEAAGSYELVTYCSVCGAEISRVTISIPQLVAGKIEESVAPVKVEYTVGDSLNLEGGKIVIVTSDSTTADVIITPEMVSGFNPDSAGVQQIRVEVVIDSVVYITTFEITVKPTEQPIVAQSVSVSKLPAKVEYKQGEALDVTGGKLTVTYSDNSTEDYEILPGWVSGFDSQKVGEQKLTVTFESVSSTLTATFNVTVSKEDDNTAISDDEAAVVNIYAYGNTIVVENATEEIYIYNAMGALIDRVNAEADRTEIIVNGNDGIYIVKTGNTVKRVMVK